MVLPLNKNQFIDYILQYYVLITESRKFGLDIEALWHFYEIDKPTDIIGWAKDFPELFIEL